MSSNTITDNRKLTICFGAANSLVESGPNTANANPLAAIRKSIEMLNHRLPWSEVKPCYEYNYHLTISPDHKRFFGKHNDRNYMCEILRKFLLDMKNKKLIKKFISVYEYGSKGKKYGHLHFHILLLTHKSNILKDEALSVFGTTMERKKFTAVIKRISINPIYMTPGTPDLFKVLDYQKQIKFLLSEYFHKESHNKIKCLFTDQIGDYIDPFEEVINNLQISHDDLFNHTPNTSPTYQITPGYSLSKIIKKLDL